jgi:hypothetical protein
MENRMFVKKTTYTDGDNFSAAARSVRDRLPVLRGCIPSGWQMNGTCL